MSKKTEASNATRLKRIMNYSIRIKTMTMQMKLDRELGFSAGYAGLPMPEAKDKWFAIHQGYQDGLNFKQKQVST